MLWLQHPWSFLSPNILHWTHHSNDSRLQIIIFIITKINKFVNYQFCFCKNAEKFFYVYSNWHMRWLHYCLIGMNQFPLTFVFLCIFHIRKWNSGKITHTLRIILTFCENVQLSIKVKWSADSCFSSESYFKKNSDKIRTHFIDFFFCR